MNKKGQWFFIDGDKGISVTINEQFLKIGSRVKICGIKKLGVVQEVNFGKNPPVTVVWPINSKNEEIMDVSIEQIERIVV